MFCRHCGAPNDDNAWKCTSCGQVIQSEHTAPTAGTDATLGGLIPSGNPDALKAYYLGIFGLIPCFGVLLGIPALVYGVKARKAAEARPEIKGKAHAWAGIILGGLSVLLSLAEIFLVYRGMNIA